MCSLNVCGLASKLKYNIIQEYIEKFDIICLTETKCLSVDEHDIKEYKCFSMSPRIKKHKYGGIHGICILVKAHHAINCHIIDTLSSESILGLHVNNKVLGYDCIIGAVYIPYEMSDYYHDDIYDFLADDIVSIKVTFDIPIILLGDFNSRTGIATDFEHLYEHECSFLEENQFTSYFKQHNIIERANRDK